MFDHSSSTKLVLTLVLAISNLNAWQFSDGDNSRFSYPQTHEWVEAHTLLGSGISYRSLERDMKRINPTTLEYLKKFRCPESDYIDEMFIDTTTQNSYMIKIECATGPHWFLYNGVISGHVSLDEVFDRDPMLHSNPDFGTKINYN